VTGRSPARLLAPLALVVCAVALFAVVNSGGDSSTGDTGDTARPEATATTTPKKGKSGDDDKDSKAAKTYTVRPGDTPSGIAEQLDVPVSELLDANPNADPNALSPGQKLKLP
jgi:LysM repeat protein